MNTSDTLNLAADLIERRGWTTGNEGRQLIGTPDAPLCLEGGILAAAGFTKYDTDAWAFAAECPAARAVHDYLGLSSDERLWEWNDAWELGTARFLRTAEQIVETLRAAAVIEAAREVEARTAVTA